MAQPVLDAHWVAGKPFTDHRTVDVVVVAPTLVAGVVRRIDKHAIHLARVQVVAVDDQIAVEPRLAYRLLGVRRQRPERHREVMVVDELLALEDQFRHGVSRFVVVV